MKKLKVIPFLLINSILATSVSLSGCVEKQVDAEVHPKMDKTKFAKPNVVIFYVDDLGYGDLSSYGMKQAKTPNVDELAKEGIRFTDAHSFSLCCYYSI